MDLNSIPTDVLVALNKGIDAELKNRQRLSEGSYLVSETVTMAVEGTIKVGADKEYTPTTSVAWTKVFAILLFKLGCVRDTIQDQVTEALRMVLDGTWEMDDALKAFVIDYEAYCDRVKSVMAQMPKAIRAGSTTAKIDISGLLNPKPIQMPKQGEEEAAA
jgi:hypothetical protein